MIKTFETFNELDPYGEENWNDENIPNRPGICVNCGSDNIDYQDTEHYDNQVIYEYFCEDCNTTGQEVYNEIFVTNERR